MVLNSSWIIFYRNVHLVATVHPNEHKTLSKLFELEAKLDQIQSENYSTINIPLIDKKFHIFTIQNIATGFLMIAILITGCFLLYLTTKFPISQPPKLGSRPNSGKDPGIPQQWEKNFPVQPSADFACLYNSAKPATFKPTCSNSVEKSK